MTCWQRKKERCRGKHSLLTTSLSWRRKGNIITSSAEDLAPTSDSTLVSFHLLSALSFNLSCLFPTSLYSMLRLTLFPFCSHCFLQPSDNKQREVQDKFTKLLSETSIPLTSPLLTPRLPLSSVYHLHSVFQQEKSQEAERDRNREMYKWKECN